MKKLLLLLLGLLLIVLLSYYCFKTKAVEIENHLLSSAEDKYIEESLEEVRVTVKGEDLNKTRILVLTGIVNSIEEKENAGKIAQNINGVYAVKNNLQIKIKKELKPQLEAISTTSIASTLIIPKLLTYKKPKQLETSIIETAITCEEKLNKKLAKDKIHFEYNKALIKKESYVLLDGLIKILKVCSQSTVYIEGHTDSKGSENYNQWLSQKRANAVKAYFVKHGIKKATLKALGYGETHPIATNKTEAGQKLNRRIEFKIKGVR